MSIKQRLGDLQRESNTYGRSQLLDYINLDFIDKMEVEAAVKPAFADALAKMRPQLDKMERDFTDYSAAMKIKEAYSEAIMLSRLQALVHIDKISETNTKTPDFRALFRGREIYVEIKSLNTIDPNAKHKDTMEVALDKKVNATDQLAAGATFAVTEQVVNPYSVVKKPKDSVVEVVDKRNDPRSVCNVAERLIDKMSQNIKAGQYQHGDSILLIDLADQLTLIAEPSDAIREYYEDPFVEKQYRTAISGELWFAAFGQVGDKIYRAPDFEGEEVVPELLEREGVLVTYPEIKGLIVHASGANYGLAKLNEETLRVIEFIDYCCHKVSINNAVVS